MIGLNVEAVSAAKVENFREPKMRVWSIGKSNNFVIEPKYNNQRPNLN